MHSFECNIRVPYVEATCHPLKRATNGVCVCGVGGGGGGRSINSNTHLLGREAREVGGMRGVLVHDDGHHEVRVAGLHHGSHVSGQPGRAVQVERDICRSIALSPRRT